MKPGVIATSMATFAVALLGASAARADIERVRGCMAPSQAHDVLIDQKLIAPFRALGEAARGGQGDAVGVQLCRVGELYVYDITLLQRDGRVSHALINARKGGLVVPGRNAK